MYSTFVYVAIAVIDTYAKMSFEVFIWKLLELVSHNPPVV